MVKIANTATAVNVVKTTRKKATNGKSRADKPQVTHLPSPARVAQPTPVAVIAQAMLDKKAEEVLSLDISALESTICDHFVIGHGRSSTQVQAIADNVEKEMNEQLHENPRCVQGKENAFWVILDYTDVVVHIFQTEYRRFYRLEDLWADAIRKTYDETQTIKLTINERNITPQ
jgi:ribosome-associated protein